jgi:hypothetical protein
MCVGFELPTSYQLVHPMELTQFELDWSELDRPVDSISELKNSWKLDPGYAWACSPRKLMKIGRGAE